MVQIGGAAGSRGNLTTAGTTIPIPVGIQEGDREFAIWRVSGSGTMTTTAPDWVQDFAETGASNAYRIEVWSRAHDPSHGDSFWDPSANISTTQTRFWARDIDNSDPYDSPIDVDFVSASGSTFVAPSVDPDGSAGLLLNFYTGVFGSGASTTADITQPGGQTEEEFVLYNGSNGYVTLLASEQLASASATGTRTATSTGTPTNATSRLSLSMVLKPAYSGPLWYVDNAASGANDGSSWTNAWESFADIDWSMIAPGDTIYISGGSTSKTYAEAFLPNPSNTNADGTSGAPILIARGVDGGHNGTPILTGSNSRPNCIEVGGYTSWAQDYLTFRGLRCENATENPIWIRDCTGVVIEDCEVEGPDNASYSQAIFANENTDFTVRGCTITTVASTVGQADGIYLQDNLGTTLIEDNTITISNTNNTGHSDVIQTHQNGATIIRNNVLITSTAGADNHGMWLHAFTTGTTTEIYNNVVISRNASAPITVWRVDGAAGHGQVNIYNNTFYGGARGVNVNRYTNLNLKNNIIQPDSGGTAVYQETNDLTAANVTHNLLYLPGSGNAARTAAGSNRSYAQWTATDGYNASGVNADPVFTSAPSDLSIQGSSPARNAGLTIGTVTTDILGQARPVGGSYDIGAYESLVTSTTYQGTSAITVETTLTADATRVKVGSAAITVETDLAAVAFVDAEAAAAMTPEVTLTAAGVSERAAGADLPVEVTLAAQAVSERAAQTALTVETDLAADGTPVLPAAVDMAAQTDVTADGLVGLNASIQVDSDLAATAFLDAEAAVAMTVEADLVALAHQIMYLGATLAAQADLLANGVSERQAGATLEVDTVLAAEGVRERVGQVALEVAADLAATAAQTAAAAVAATVEGEVLATPDIMIRQAAAELTVAAELAAKATEVASASMTVSSQLQATAKAAMAATVGMTVVADMSGTGLLKPGLAAAAMTVSALLRVSDFFDPDMVVGEPLDVVAYSSALQYSSQFNAQVPVQDGDLVLAFHLAAVGEMADLRTPTSSPSKTWANILAVGDDEDDPKLKVWAIVSDFTGNLTVTARFGGTVLHGLMLFVVRGQVASWQADVEGLRGFDDGRADVPVLTSDNRQSLAVYGFVAEPAASFSDIPAGMVELIERGFFGYGTMAGYKEKISDLGATPSGRSVDVSGTPDWAVGGVLIRGAQFQSRTPGRARRIATARPVQVVEVVTPRVVQRTARARPVTVIRAAGGFPARRTATARPVKVYIDGNLVVPIGQARAERTARKAHPRIRRRKPARFDYTPEQQNQIRYIAQRWDGTWLDWDVPLHNPLITHNLDAPATVTGHMEPEYARMLNEDGQPLMKGWGTHLYAENESSEELYAACIVRPVRSRGQQFPVDAIGFSSWAKDWRYISELWSRTDVDRFDVVRELWREAQSRPGRDLGIVVSNNLCGRLLGTETKTETVTNPDGTTTEREVPVPYELSRYKQVDCGREIEDLVKSTPFDFEERQSWRPSALAVDRFVDLYYPRIGTRKFGLTFDENNIRAVPAPGEDPGAFADFGVGLGSGDGSEQVFAIVQRRAADRLSRMYVHTDKSIGSKRRLEELLSGDLKRLANQMEMPEIVVDAWHDHARYGSYRCGDEIQVDYEVPWFGDLSIWHRIVQRQLNPITGLVKLKLRRADSFTYRAAPETS